MNILYSWMQNETKADYRGISISMLIFEFSKADFVLRKALP